MEQLLRQAAPPPPPAQLVPWYYQDDPVGPPAPPRPPQGRGLIEAAQNAYKQSMDAAVKQVQSGGSPRDAASSVMTGVPLGILDGMFPEYYQKEYEKKLNEVLPESLQFASPFLAGIADFDPADLMNPMAMAKAPVKGAVKAAKAAAKGAPLDKVGKLKAAMYDSMEGLKGFDQDLYESARRYAGTAKQAEEDVAGFAQALSPIKARGFKENVEDMLNVFRGKPTRFDRAGQYAMLDRMEEAAQLVDGPVAGMGLDDIKAAKEGLENSISVGELARIKTARDAVTQKFNAQLDEAVEVGMVSRQSADAAKQKGLKYVPLHVLADDATEELGGAAKYGGHSANPNLDWFRRMQSSAEQVELQNPFDEALVTHTSAARRNIEKNKVMNTLAALPQKDPQFQGLVIPLETAELRQGRIDLSKSIQETQRRIAEISGAIDLEEKAASSLYDKFKNVQRELGGLAGELAEKNLNWEPRPEIQKTIQKIQRKQARVLGAYRKMGEHAEGAGLFDLNKALSEAETEIKLAKSQLWQMRPQKLPEGFKEVKRFKNGLQERWAVPAEVADTLMRMNKEQVDLVTTVAATASKALRFGATAGNIAFLPTNVIRDFGTTAIRSNNGLNPVNLGPRWIESFYRAAVKDDVYKDFIKNGGGYATFAEVLNARPSTMAGATGWGARFGKTVTTPSELFKAVTIDSPPMRALTWMNETAELAPRLAEYSAALRAGKTPQQAAFAGRDITVDFMKAGDVTRVANMWVPFLNANLQGSANVVKTLRDGGPSTYLKLGGMVGLPAAVTYAWNTKNFPDVWDDISEHDKNENHIIITSRDRDEETGRYYTGVIRIPKNQFSKLLANPFEEALDYTRKNQPIEYAKIAAKALGTLSPVGGIDDEGNPSITDVASNVTPPFIKAPLEAGMNKNFYTKRDIVPQSMEKRSPELQFFPESTPKSAVWLGEKTGTSPLKIEQAVRTMFGGLGGQVMEPGRLKKDFERRFGRAYGGQLDREEIKKIQKLERTEEDAKARSEASMAKLKGKSAAEIEKVLKAEDPKDVWAWGMRKSDRDNLSPLESYLKRGSVSAKVKETWAREYLKTLTADKRKATLEHWTKYKVISADLLEELKK